MSRRPDLVALRALHRRGRGGGGGDRHRGPLAADDVPVARGRDRGPARAATSRRHGDAVPRTDRDVPGWVVLAVPALVVHHAVRGPGPAGRRHGGRARGSWPRSASRSSASPSWWCRRASWASSASSSNPTSGMALVTLLGVSVVFVALGWTDPSAARGDPHRRHRRLRRRLEGGRHLAGPEDRVAGRRHAGAPAVGQFIGAAFACWARRRDGAAAGQGLHVRLAGAAGAAGDADEDRDRGRAVGRAAVGPGGHRRRASRSGAMLAGLPGLPSRSGSTCRSASLTPDLRGRRRAAHRRGAPARARRRRATPACWRRRG